MLRRSDGDSCGGFTLLELMVGAVIFGMVAAVAITAYVTLNQMWQADLALIQLSRDANIVMEKMVRGRPANTGLMAAQSVEAPISGASGDSVNYTDMNGTAREFYYSNNKIYSESGTAIAENVGSVTFYNINNTIRIDLAMYKYAGRRPVNFSIQTQVDPRN